MLVVPESLALQDTAADWQAINSGYLPYFSVVQNLHGENFFYHEVPSTAFVPLAESRWHYVAAQCLDANAQSDRVNSSSKLAITGAAYIETGAWSPVSLEIVAQTPECFLIVYATTTIIVPYVSDYILMSDFEGNDFYAKPVNTGGQVAIEVDGLVIPESITGMSDLANNAINGRSVRATTISTSPNDLVTFVEDEARPSHESATPDKAGTSFIGASTDIPYNGTYPGMTTTGVMLPKSSVGITVVVPVPAGEHTIRLVARRTISGQESPYWADAGQILLGNRSLAVHEVH